MIGFAFMISSAHNELGWTRHGAGSQELRRSRVCSVGGCREENTAALQAGPGLMSEITHQNNQTFTNSPPTGNNSAVKQEINQMCVGQIVWGVKLILIVVSTCVQIFPETLTINQLSFCKVVHLLTISMSWIICLIHQPGRPTSVPVLWVGVRPRTGAMGPAAGGEIEHWDENVNTLSFLSAPGLCLAPLYYICHFCCSFKWTLNHPRTWEKYFTIVCCIYIESRIPVNT